MADETPQAPWPRPTVLEQSTQAAHEVADNLAEKADRAKEVAAEQTAGLRRDPASAAIVAQLTRQTELLAEIAQAGERREKPAPGIWHLPFTTHVRIRAMQFNVSRNGAGTLDIALRVGANDVVKWRVASIIQLDNLYITVDRGQQVDVIDLATGAPVADLLDAWITGYPE